MLFKILYKHKCEHIKMINPISQPPLSLDSENQRKFFSKCDSKGWKSAKSHFFIENNRVDATLKKLSG